MEKPKKMTDSTDIFNQPGVIDEGLMDTIIAVKEMLVIYSCAMKETKTRLEILNLQCSISLLRNPIKTIETRLKSISSITEKLQRISIDFTLDNIEQNITDIAGVRVICTYIDDIYSIAEALISQDDIDLISKKDYIENPKPNGYRSLHLIINIPVYIAGGMKRINVEVQIRTIAMDFWASLEHQIKYKP